MSHQIMQKSCIEIMKTLFNNDKLYSANIILTILRAQSSQKTRKNYRKITI